MRINVKRGQYIGTAGQILKAEPPLLSDPKSLWQRVTAIPGAVYLFYRHIFQIALVVA